jgi:hypothetical protein
VYVFAKAALLAGEHVTSPCALDANAQSDANGPYPLGFTSTPNTACTADYTRGECSFMYRYILRESRSQFDSLPLTSL